MIGTVITDTAVARKRMDDVRRIIERFEDCKSTALIAAHHLHRPGHE